MVFESVVTDVLNKVLGDYVENLDKTQLKIGIWGGDVILNNLKLRENALDELNLPVQLVFGYLGKLVLKIPWKNLYSQPVVAQIEDLYILISPKQSVEYDAEKEEQFELQAKQAMLQEIDVATLKELDKDKPKPDATFSEKLTAQIVNNLQMKIANVHIRYEDTSTTGKPFSFGATLHELEIYTTDLNWVKCYLTEQVSRVYKIANLDALSVYMNIKGELYASLSHEELSNIFRKNIAHKDLLPEQYSYVLGPISSIAKLRLNMNPEYDSPPYEIPKIDLTLEMEKLNIGLTSTQFQDILKLADSMNRMKLGAPYRKYRPFNTPYKNHYKEWWKFAINSVLEEDIRKKNRCWTWEFIREHRELCNSYSKKLKEKELSTKPPASLTESCTLIEQKLDIFSLILIRKRVQFDVAKIKKEQEKKEAEKPGWFGGWFGGGKKNLDEEPSDIVKKFEAAMTQDERDKLYKAIGYQENAAPLNIPESYESINMNFKLVALEIGLYDDTKELLQNSTSTFDFESLLTIMLLKFSMATCSVQQRPAASALSLTAGMKEMQLSGLVKEKLIPAPIIIESKVTDDFNLLDIFFETNPLDKQCDQRIKVHARPLQIVYDSDTILHLIKVFSPPKSVNLSELEGAASEKVANFKERSATGMQYIIETHSVIEVDIKLMPNILIIPSSGTYKPGQSSMIVVSLGQLHLTSKPHERTSKDVATLFESGQDQQTILENVMKKAYDKYKICIEDVQILVAKPKESWEDILLFASLSEMHVLRPTTVIITTDLCVVGDDPRLSKAKVDLVLPSIHINLTEDRIFEALRVLTSIPLPENETLEAVPLMRAVSSASRLSMANFLTQEALKVKDRKSNVDSTAVEVVQYTNLELSFALNEFSVTLNKTSHITGENCSNESPTDSDKFGTPIEDVALIDEFADTASHISAKKTPAVQKILALQILQLEANMAQRTYELVATAKLGAISLTQYDEENDSEEVYRIIETPRFSEEMEYLLTVAYTMANKTSPEFTTKYNSTEQLITVHFTTLNVMAHQECLLRLIDIAKTLQQQMDSINKLVGPRDRMATAADEGMLNKLSTILEETEGEAGGSATRQPQNRKRPSKVVESIKIHVIANMEQVSLLLTCCKRPVASLKVEYFNAGVILKSSYTELNLRLKDIIVTDLNPKNIHTGILSIVGNNALDCQVVLYNLDETSNYNSDDMKVTVEIGCVKIVFLNWFVNSVLTFLNHFQAAQQAVVNASAAAADAAKQNALDAYEKATRMKLNIKIKAPIIVVPIDSQSLDAIALDLGYLMLSNTTAEVRVPHEERSPAVIDEIKLELRDMKLSKCAILRGESIDAESITIRGSIDTVDLAYGIKSKVNILDPISFTLGVKRNLSGNWYHAVPEIDLSGRLDSIELNLFNEDYALIMSILNRNLQEGLNEFPVPRKAPQHRSTNTAEADIHSRESRIWESPTHTSLVRRTGTITEKAKIYEQLKFNLQFDGVIVNFMLGIDDGLARFGLYFLSIKGSKLINGTLTTSVVLCNIQIDDTRKNTNSKITKYLCRKNFKLGEKAKPSPSTDILDYCKVDREHMLDLTAIIKENDTFTEVRVFGFDLILCIDFLLQLADFVKLPESATADELPHKVETKAFDPKTIPKAQSNIRSTTSSVAPPATKNKMNLILHIEEPDIILVESLEDINTNAIIFNAQAHLNYRILGDKQLINGQIDALKMYMCSFMPERRESTKHYIIHPCVISLQGSTPEHEGLHISLKLSEIIINVSPATIELVNKAMLTISTNSAEKSAENKKEANYSELWDPKKFNENDFWFIKVDEAEDALEVISEMKIEHELFKHKTEKCIVEVPSIMLVVEMGVGYYTTPLISVDTKLNAIVTDWSRKMSISGSLCLNMNYYNQALAVWEPLIEMNERTNRSGMKEYLPWELSFGLEIETKKSEFDETVEEQTTKIQIHSEEMLELTLSKTCLELLGVLGEAFSQAIDAKGLVKPEVIAPYVVENDTGFEISINFKRGIFTLHECHMPKTQSPNTLNRSLVFEADEADNNFTPEQVKHCKISAGGRAFLQTKDLSTITSEEDEEYNIYVMVGGIDKEIVLPVSKSDKRYFPLYRDTNQDPWGIISEVRSEFGTTKINIHGVVNVHNHFTTNVNIYRQKQNSMEKVFVGEVAPGEVYHVPLHAIYADNKDLHFSLHGYLVSVQGVKWNDSPSDLNYSRQIQCDPMQTFEPFYINAIREKTEIFYEDTNKFKLLSAYYTIHLRPPLFLRNALPIHITVSVAGCSVRQFIDPNQQEDDESKELVKEDLLDYGEKQVNPGDVLHLPTVKIRGRGSEGKSFLVLRLLQYLEKDWSCTTEISYDNTNLAVWTFTSYDSAAKMDMDLCVRFESGNGSLVVTLFSPFWMINKTGLMLSYKTDTESVDVLYHPPEYNGPILFSFREKFFFDKKRASIRVDNGAWSNYIPLDVAGSIGAVTCKANDVTYEIGVHNHLTNNSLTKQITFIPFFIASNKCEFVIELQESSRPGDPWVKVDPNSCQPIWPKNDSDHLIVAKVQGQCTVAFNYSEVQCTLLQLHNNKYGGINVDVQTTEGGVYITFTEYNPGDAPGLLINHTSKQVTYQEKGSKIDNILNPGQAKLYTWNDPAGDKCILFGRNLVESDLRRDGVGELILPDGAKGFWVSFLDGLQRVLLFTEVEAIASKSESSSTLQSVTQSIEIRIHGIGLSVLNNETGVDILYLGVTSSGIIWECKKENKKRFKQMNIHDTHALEAQYQLYLLDKSINKQGVIYSLDNKWPIDFELMTLKKQNTIQLKRTFYPGVWISKKSSPFQTQLHAKINKIQIDNQLTDCIFPVVLAPIAPPKSVATTTALKPFVELSMVERVVPHSTVKQFKYASMLIQEFHFKVDLLFLTGIAELFSNTTNEEQAAKLFNEDVLYIEKPLSDLVETHSLQEQKHFYDNLHLGPLKIHVSFSMAGSDTTALPGILSTLVQGVGVTLTDVNDVVFRLAFFEREYTFFTQRQLMSEITTHYTGQALKQLYVLVLGLDVLGNPYGLVVGLKKGVEDLFYEPFQGAIQGPGEFAEGLVLGVKSLFGHTVGGAAGAVSKITGAMGKGLAALTFDDEYQKKRRQNLNKKPANFQEGIARSSKGLVMGFFDGVTGVVSKPVSGAKEEGVEGFFKGLGKGAIGLVARPTAGVVDFASGSFEAVKRATESSEEAQRLRPPRFLHQDNVLRAYCLDEAQGNKMLKEIEKGKYGSTDTFGHCEEIVQKHEFVLVTNHRVIYAQKNDLFGTWAVQWSYLWHEIASIISSERGVELTLKKEAKKMMGLFSTHEAQRKVILIPQKSRRDNLTEIMESLRKEK